MKPTQQPSLDQMKLALVNKEKFLEGSHTPMRLYHGTTATEGGKGKEAIRNLKPSKEGALGSGVYLTPKAEFAGEYAKKSSGNVLPVHARITNPLVINSRQGEDPMIHALVKLGVTPDKAANMVEKAYEERGYIGKQVQQRAQAAGHDALMQYRDGDLSEVVHYNPRMVKSATGNRGTYDTTKDDLTMAGGGRVKDPKSTVKAYKLFRVDPKKPGQLFPLFVDANTPVKMGKWVNAKSGEMKDGKVKSKIGALAYRPGWHAGDLPIATHIGEKSDSSLTAPDTRPDNHAWAEVEMPNDVDWQTEATKRGTNAQGKVVPVKAHITDQIPKGGHYRYKTNPNMTGNWLIGGSMKVNRVLDDDEVSRINDEAGLADLPRANPFDAKKFGFADGGKVSGLIAPDEWKAEEYVNHMAAGGTPPSLDQMKLALNQQGMYSPLEKAAMAVPRNKGTPAEFMAEVSKQPGFRKDEVADRKIELPEQKMTKPEFMAHLKKHPSPRLTEKVIDDEDTEYGGYQLPGGKHYQEVLLKLPHSTAAKDMQIMSLEADLRRMDPANYPPEQMQPMIDKLNKLKAEKAAMGEPYQSSHWNNDPNVLAHIRMSDRKTPEGKKLLHIEEIQSDWHQAGRKEGYKTSEDNAKKARFEELGQKIRRGIGTTAEMDESARIQSELSQFNRMVPDAPFKKNWHELALKHVLGKAAKEGYEGIAITPGQEQADRYDLSKHVQNIYHSPNADGTFHASVMGPRGQVLWEDFRASPDKIEQHLGKDIAQKITSGHGAEENGMRRLDPADMKMGGEGMKGFYDKMIPDYLNKLGKPHGAKVQMNSMPVVTKPENRTPQIAAPGIGHFPPDQVEPAQTANLHYFQIPDTMRQQIKTEGLPQYHAGGIIHKAEGGNVQPNIAQMRMALNSRNPIEMQTIGVNEAPNMSPKAFFSPDRGTNLSVPPPGGVATPSGAAIGGVDVNQQQPGQQLMAAPPQPQGGLTPQPNPPQPGQPPQGGMAPPAGPPGPPIPGGGGGILQMTPQGRAMSALGGSPAPGMASGGSAKSVDDMKSELAESKAGPQDKRVTVHAEGPGGVKGLVVPRHTLEGNAKSGAVGIHQMNEARAKVYGEEHRPPLTLNKIAQAHRDTLKEHFAKPVEEQHAAEKEALQRLRNAKHLGKDANTLDESEKLDTVRHEYDEQGRSHVGFASKGVAGHALYTSGKGDDTKYHVINTCPGQTEGCGGGKDSKGIVDTKKGTCFAPNAESQYPGAATRRAAHEQAKHDPAMTNDWILAHTGSLRNAARLADRHNQRLLFRPNVVDETDVSSRHAIRHLNEQRKEDGKPAIIANSYGKTNELHDPENGYYVTHSNVGPKVKKGKEVSENIGRDKARVRNTIMAADNKGDFKNEQGNLTPPKGSYMVTDVKRNSDMSKKMEKAITHAKYWSTGRSESELTPQEKAEGSEGHFGGNGKPTTPEKAHFGHTTVDDKRFDYQKQHVVHPRLVQVGKNKDGTPHMIPTDSRFKDEEFLPKNRFKTKNGKDAGHILMTTPTESTSNIGHQTSFTHHVGDSHIEHAQKTGGEYEIDKPEEQVKAAGKEYAAPQSIKFYAEGGNVGYAGRHPGLNEDDFHAFPESNFAAQRHLAMRGNDHEKAQTSSLPYHAGHKKAVVLHKDLDTMRLEMTKKAK